MTAESARAGEVVLEHRGDVTIRRDGSWGAIKATALKVVPPKLYLSLRKSKERIVEAVTQKYPYVVKKSVGGVGYEMIVGNGIEEGEIVGPYAEEDLIARMIDLSQPGDTLIDIGAAVGTHTVPLAKHLGPKGKVYAVEPDRQVIKAMQGNIDLNAIGNVHIIPTALWDRDTDLIIHTEGRRGEAPQVTEVGTGQIGKRLTNSAPIKARSIDSLVNDGRISVAPGARIIAKIDVEGAGERVLNGMTKLKPNVIFIEVHPQFGENLDRITSMLSGRGYKLTSQNVRVEQIHCIFELTN